MSTNELIEDQLKWFINLNWREYLAENPLHLNDFTPGQLNRLLSKVQKTKRAAKTFCESVNPPLDHTRQHSGWMDADFIEKLVTAELQSRQALTAAPEVKAAQGEPRRKGKPTQIQYVLFYKYLQAAGLYPEFDGSNGKTKLAMCTEIGKRHGISNEKFEQFYNKVSIKEAKASDIEAVIIMLSHDPEHLEAKRRAEDGLKIARAKEGKRNP